MIVGREHKFRYLIIGIIIGIVIMELWSQYELHVQLQGLLIP
jgi:uncharacterized membrane-anchored protein YhcB (DUF1043 family)